jgi:hypothetical protein
MIMITCAADRLGRSVLIPSPRNEQSSEKLSVRLLRLRQILCSWLTATLIPGPPVDAQKLLSFRRYIVEPDMITVKGASRHL